MKALLLFVFLILCIDTKPINATSLDYNDTEVLLQRWKVITQMIYEENPSNDFSSFRDFRNTIYDELSQAFYQEFLVTGNAHFLVLAINEASPAHRAMLKELHPLDDLFISAHIIRRSERLFSSHLFEIRDFTLSDIYLFSFVPLSNVEDQKIIDLLQHWTQKLPRLRRTSPLTAQIMALVISHGYQRVGEQAPVNELFRQFDFGRDLFPSHYTLFNLRTLIFQAHQQNYLTIALQLSRNLAYPLANSLGDTRLYYENLIDLANIRFDLGFILEAMSDYERLLSDGFGYLVEEDIALIRNNLAVTYLNSGQFDNFLNFSLDAYSLAKSTENKRYQLFILNNLYNYHRRQGDFSQAREFLNEILALSENEELKTERPLALIALALYYRDTLNDYNKAYEAYSEAEVTAISLNDMRSLRLAMLGLANTLNQLENYDASLAVLNSISRRTNLTKGEPFYIEIELRKVATFIRMQEWESATDILNFLSDTDLRKLPFNTFVEAKSLQARFLAQNKEEHKAIELLESIMPEVLIWLEESADTQTGFIRLDSEFSKMFSLLNSLYLKSGSYEKSLILLDQFRNLSRSVLFSNPLLKTRLLSEEDLFQHFTLTNRIQRLRNEIASENRPGNRILLQSQIIHAQNQRNQLLSKVLPDGSESESFSKLSQLRRYLTESEQILHIAIFDEELFVYGITQDSVQTKTFPFSRTQEQSIQETLNLMASGKTDLIKLHQIYDSWFSDLIDTTKSKLMIIPDGVFYRLPFETLPISKPESAQHYGTTKYLIEKYQVSYVSSLSEFINNQYHEKRDYRYFFSGFGLTSFTNHQNRNLTSLPFAETEIAQITDIFPRLKTLNGFTNKQSTEGKFRAKAGESAIIHIASHSEVSNNHPLFSVIFFQPDSLNTTIENDGLVYVYELFEMNLQSELVFLGSCSSGSGTFIQGSGILGFSRAISYAGARSLIMNLWPVRDQSSAELSVKFYSYLNQGFSRSESLRLAKIDFINQRNSNPAIWGALVLYGDTSAINTRNSLLPVLGLLFGIAMVLLIIIIGINRYSTKKEII